MKAYSGEIKKAEFVAVLKRHQEADRFIQGFYWDTHDKKGCAVGCGIESIKALRGHNGIRYDDHAAYAEALKIPVWLAQLEDKIFEGVSIERSKTWPVEFAEAIPEGVDIEPVKTKFLVMTLEHALGSLDKCKYDAEKNPDVKKAIDGSKAAVRQMIEALKSGDPEKIKAAAWAAARAAAWAAERAAVGAAAERAAADAAREAADAASAAREAADAASAAREAADAASAADVAAYAASAADVAAYAAWAARAAVGAADVAAWTTRAAAWVAAYEHFANKLLEFLGEVGGD